MNTPIADFLREYEKSPTVRFHMPGHKGRAYLGCEGFDITEIMGADSLYEADGIIAESEANASRLFGSKATFYSTEGSSQCIRAMLYLLIMNRPVGSKPLILAARNVHKSFIYAAALIGFDVEWLLPEVSGSICGCKISPDALEKKLSELEIAPAAVYVTSPDYLGGMADIPALAEVCHRHGTRLAVDNAHGAYLHFLEKPIHPLDLGADICCDSAHKTLPVLTGGAYLHISENLPDSFASQAKTALELFGSTSPSYLIMGSLDLCNRYLAENIRRELSGRIAFLTGIRQRLYDNGWILSESDPLRLTIRAPMGITGQELAGRLRDKGVECEYSDVDYLVLMTTPQNPESDFERLIAALDVNERGTQEPEPIPVVRSEQVVPIRKALFSPHETVPADEALGRICGAPTVSCPPAIPIAVSGERIGREAIELFRRYNIGSVDVLQ